MQQDALVLHVPYEPGAQAAQAVAPTPLHVPNPQGAQAARPGRALKVPAAQAVQNSEDVAEEVLLHVAAGHANREKEEQ